MSDDIQQLKQEIEQLKTDIAIKENELNRIMKNLKDKYGITSLEHAEELADELLEEINIAEQRKEKLNRKAKEKLEKFEDT